MVAWIYIALALALFSTTSSASIRSANLWQGVSVICQLAHVFCFLKGVHCCLVKPFYFCGLLRMWSPDVVSNMILYLDICLSTGLAYTDRQALAVLCL
jgi:hypothetical protein